MSATTWTNWGRNQTCFPAAVAHPGELAELVELVKRAADEDRPVKVIGAGHSFTGIGLTDGVLVQLDRYAAVRSVDRSSSRIVVEAGLGLYALNATLAEHGLALPNLGDIDRQTVAGAISTGTHGTGLHRQGLAAAVAGLELVLADGSVVSCSAQQRPELFAAARVGLGALGVISTVTLACVPAFTLRAREAPGRLGDVLAGFDELAEAHDHFEFYWFPHTDRVQTKCNDVVSGSDRPLGRLRGWVDDELLANGVFELGNRLAARVPATVRPLSRLAARALSGRDYTAASHQVLCSPRRVRFTELEYNVPRAAVTDVVRDIEAMIERDRLRISFPVEVRVSAPDDIWLSTAYQRDSAYVAVHLYRGQDHNAYFRAVEQIAGAVGGRPHWGKMHWLDAATLRRRYPRFDDFVALRDHLDPRGLFSNRYLDRVLGAAPESRR